MSHKEEILQVLKAIQDPELKRDIVSLGMLKEMDVQGGQVSITLNFPGGPSPVTEEIQKQIRMKLGAVSGVQKVDIKVVAASAQKPASTRQSIPGIHDVIAVASGKGGVGKTTVAVNLALALQKRGASVGLMDGDIYGPNVPLMLGVPNETRPKVTDDDKIIPIQAMGLKMISMGVLVPADQPMVWRGPMLHSAVTQFLQKVDWGELDVLLVDLPPGTGDVQLSLVQNVPLSGAVIVTTPQEVALMDVRKGIAMFRKTEVPILGVIENMTGEVFGRGGGKKAAEQFQAPYLGEIPLDARIREGGDQGKPIFLAAPDSPASQGFAKAAEALDKSLSRAAYSK
jgi:ATP-binding protein involved in chromosome partitioning